MFLDSSNHCLNRAKWLLYPDTKEASVYFPAFFEFNITIFVVIDSSGISFLSVTSRSFLIVTGGSIWSGYYYQNFDTAFQKH